MGGRRFIATMGTKRGSDGGTSEHCTLITKGDTLANARKMIEENYEVKEVFKRRQGLSTVVAYRIDLMGEHRKLGVTVIHNPTLGGVVWALLERRTF